jgi:hypothetical protein
MSETAAPEPVAGGTEVPPLELDEPTTEPEPEASDDSDDSDTPLPSHAPDWDAIHEATQAHDAAVTEAHDTLKERLENAYRIFSDDLTRAMRVWKNHVADVKDPTGSGRDDSEDRTNGADPTTVK